MAKWVRKTDGAEVLDTDKLELSKSMRLLDTDLGQQLMSERRGNNVSTSNDQKDGQSVQ